MKVRLVEPPPPGVTLFAMSALPRLGLPLAAAALAAEGHDVRVYAPIVAPLDEADLADADLVGISATTATAPAAYALADRLRARGVPVVLGGPHVTFLPEEGLAHADYVARGEGGATPTASPASPSAAAGRSCTPPTARPGPTSTTCPSPPSTSSSATSACARHRS